MTGGPVSSSARPGASHSDPFVAPLNASAEQLRALPPYLDKTRQNAVVVFSPFHRGVTTCGVFVEDVRFFFKLDPQKPKVSEKLNGKYLEM